MLEVYFESYGCTANQNSTEIMKGLVKQAGLNITINPVFADIIIINSCIVKEPTQEKIRRKVFDYLSKGKKVILSGCMPRLNQKRLKKENLFLLDTSQVKNLLNLIKDMLEDNYSEKYLENRNEVKLNLPKIPHEKLIGITQISEGCLGECAYCIVRLAKGKLFSYPQENIIESVKKDLESGCKEIWLTSQDNAAYGNEYSGKYLLPELLKDILELPHRFYLRLGMMNPNNVIKILPELIELYKHPKMFKFLHLPIQSGSDKILKAMNRKYKIKDVMKIINAFQKEMPEITIATDIIAGFPGESDKDFQETLNLIKKINPEILNRSNFGSRPGTPAEKLKQISPTKMKKRASELMKLHLQICNSIQKPWLGKEIKVFVDKKGFGNTWLGRTENYKLVAIPSKEKLMGKTIKAKVKKIYPHYLICEKIH